MKKQNRTPLLSSGSNSQTTSNGSLNSQPKSQTSSLLVPSQSVKRKTRSRHKSSTRRVRRNEDSTKRRKFVPTGGGMPSFASQQNALQSSVRLMNMMPGPWIYSCPPFKVNSSKRDQTSDSSTSETSTSRDYATSSRTESTDTNVNQEWGHIEGMILHTAVAAYATQANFDSSTKEVDIEKLDWESIAKHFPKHTAVGCYHYWKTLNPETSLLRSPQGVFYVHNNVSEDSSVRVGPFTTSSSGDFSNSGNPTRRRRKKREKAPWSEEEEKLIDQLQQELGNKWTKIAQHLGNGRTGNDVKNYWHSVKDKIITNRFKRKQKITEVNA